MSPAAQVISYHDRLNADPEWAFQEGGLHFEGKSAVQTTLLSFCQRLDELSIPYAVVGAIALFRHGYRRVTSDIDILVTEERLRTIHQVFEGHGYVRREGRNTLFSIETGVPIKFVVTGQFPGDGKPKPIAFPDPTGIAVRIGNVNVIALPRLIDMKLAAGIDSIVRLKHHADVIEAIKAISLPRSFGEELSEYVRPKFDEYWIAAQTPSPFEH